MTDHSRGGSKHLSQLQGGKNAVVIGMGRAKEKEYETKFRVVGCEVTSRGLRSHRY